MSLACVGCQLGKGIREGGGGGGKGSHAGTPPGSQQVCPSWADGSGAGAGLRENERGRKKKERACCVFGPFF